MKPKKHQKHNIDRDTGIYFSFSLAIVLALTYFALEWKTYDVRETWNTSMSVEGELLEDVPITIHEIKPPPPKLMSAPKIEIAPDEDKDIIESLIESTEANTDTKILEVEDITVIESPEDEEIPFIAIEEVPLFPGCEKEEDKRACFQQMIHNHVKSNFRYPEKALEAGLQGKVYIMFVINKDGSIGEVRMRSPHDILGEEAERIIAKLPRMTPGKQRGKAVRVSFSLPMIFKLQ